MALQFAHGAIQWLAADAVNTTYTVSGLAFKPKALRFYVQGLGSATDASSQTAHWRKCVGFATSPTDRQCVASQDQDAAGTQVCTTGHSSSAAVMTVTSSPAADGLLDVNAINSDGFQMIVDDQVPVDITVFWEAWGGDAIDQAATGNFAEPGVTGNQSTAIGWKPSVLMLAGIQGTALNTVARNDSGLSVGFASSNRTDNNCVIVGNSDDASLTSDTDCYCQTGECLAMIVVAGGNATARAKLQSFDQGGFTLNWLARATTNRRSIYLAISGGQWAAGAYTIAGNSASATATVSGLPFTPIGVSVIGTMTTQPAAGVSNVQDRMGLGSGSSTSSRRSMGGLSQDAQGTAALINLTMQYDQVLSYPDTAAGLLAAYDINAVNNDGFQIIVDTAGGVASEWQGYLTFGGRTSPTFNNYQSASAGSGVSVAERVR